MRRCVAPRRSGMRAAGRWCARPVGRGWRRKGRRSGGYERAAGKKWSWSENTASVHSVGKGFFPLDEELALLPGVLTPHGHECLVRLAGWMPFEKATELLTDFMGIRVGEIVSTK